MRSGFDVDIVADVYLAKIQFVFAMLALMSPRLSRSYLECWDHLRDPDFILAVFLVLVLLIHSL